MMLWPDYTHASTQQDKYSSYIWLQPFVKLCESFLNWEHFVGRGADTDSCHIRTQSYKWMNTVQHSHLYGKDGSGSPWGMLVVAFVPTGALLSRTSEMEIGVEPVHRKGLWRVTSISPVTLSADTLRNIGHLLPWWLRTGSGLTAVKPHYKKE